MRCLVYEDLLDDPDIQHLPDDLFRTLIYIVHLLDRCDGVVPIKILEIILRSSEATIQERLDQLCALDLVDAVSGGYRPKHWEERIRKSQLSTRRVRKFRERQKARYQDETPSVSDETLSVSSANLKRETFQMKRMKRSDNPIFPGKEPVCETQNVSYETDETLSEGDYTLPPFPPSSSPSPSLLLPPTPPNNYSSSPPSSPPLTPLSRPNDFFSDEMGDLFPETVPEPAVEKPKSVSSKPNSVTTPEFDEFWKIYPRREGKGQAIKAFDRAIRNGVLPATILEGAKRYAGARAREDPQFTRHPATWLNGQCWLDEPQNQQEVYRDKPSAMDNFMEGAALFLNERRKNRTGD